MNAHPSAAEPSRLDRTALLSRAARLSLAAFDVDGTLTDGRLGYGDDGHEFKSFDVHDGQGLKLLARIGVEIAWITARSSPLVARRAADLGVRHLIQGCHDKGAALSALCASLRIPCSEAAFMGDDLPDLAAMAVAGLSVAPANAHPWVLERVEWQTRAAGGSGAAREFCDLVIEAKGRREELLSRFSPA
ncbi:MAG: HAD hydrolase family protein [Aquimonas sp.]|nr:HAD hydrolase family protein [Aquimonas sp.]